MDSKLIDQFSSITRWPKKRNDKELVIKFLSEQFEVDRIYPEKEINHVIKHHHSFNDVPLLRRELVSRKYLERKDDCSLYWRVK
tara:strand:- start:2443 stop:2694 length:252 start_codon:yes stop_codon:yes gene_type:complete